MPLFASQSLETLADQLTNQLLPGLSKQLILVPNLYVKKWLLIELAKRRGIAMGLLVLTPTEWLVKQGFMSPNSLEMKCLIYRSVKGCHHPELQSYLESGQRRLLDLTEPLSHLFFQYALFGFEKTEGWQGQILEELFVKGPWKLPVQWLEGAPVPSYRVHCFGIDALPSVYWQWLLKYPSLSIYLFSPCLHYWGDVCSDRERRQRLRYWRKTEASEASRQQLETYLSEAPSLLGNWGKVGRECLRLLDPWELEVEECYAEVSGSTLLDKLKESVLTFEKGAFKEADSSIQIVRTGSSIHQEVSWLKEEIVRLVVQEGLRWDEVAVLAPRIEPYAPWISFLFEEIPHRIYGVNENGKSPFSRGLRHLAELAQSSRWSKEEVLALFEAGAFTRKQNWSLEELELFRKWLGSVEWGLDATHRREVVGQLLPDNSVGGEDSWEVGLDALLDRIVFFKEGMEVECDLFEEFLVVFESLKTALLSFRGEATLAVWADRLETLVAKFLFADSDDEGAHTFRQLLMQLRQSALRLGEELFPFALIEQFLRKESQGELHASQLHAVRFASLEEGSLLPAKALFLVGMDEESFPLKEQASSLNLVKKESPSLADQGRYQLLQALFGAGDFLRISYSHLSEQEGKEVGASLPLQELLSALGPLPIVTTLSSRSHRSERPLFGAEPKVQLPQGEVVIPIRDLSSLARHPWKFYLQKKEGLFIEDEREDTFAFLKSRILRASLQKPLEWEELPRGIVGEALRLEIEEERSDWEKVLETAGARPLVNLPLADFVFPVREGLTVRITGEIANVSPQGLVIPASDQMESVLKVWPEALIVAIAQNTPQILCLKTGKSRPVNEPHEALRKFLEYYFCALEVPSPLLPEWADGLLRRGPSALEKKLKGSRWEDPVFDWVAARYALPSAEAICEQWSLLLKEVFAPLTALYPTRGKGAHAEV